MRAFFASGVENMHVPWAVEGLPTLLHLSLFLFFWGLVIFLFNVDHEVFITVVWWIGLFSTVYGLITVLPMIRHASPYNSPLSTPVWFLYARIHHVTFKIFVFITRTRRNHFPQKWISGGVEKAAEETVSERSSKIDVQILNWTISALGDDDSQKSFFDAIPGFFNSKSMNHLKRDYPMELLGDTLDGFLERTLSSNSVGDSEKLRRLDIAMNAMSVIRQNGVSSILRNILYGGPWSEVPQTVEMGLSLAHWCSSSDQSVAQVAQQIVARILVTVRERNDSWAKLAASTLGVNLRDNISLGDDSVLLVILIHVTKQSRTLRTSSHFNYPLLVELSNFDISNTHSALRHEFCMLWSEIVQEASMKGYRSTPVFILHGIRHLYTTLHQGTSAAPIAASTDRHDILYEPSSYPFCNLACHRPDLIPQMPAPNSREVTHPSTPSNSPDASSHPPTDGSDTTSTRRQAE